MMRKTGVFFDKAALSNNLKEVKRLAPGKKIIAMVKANAYGCGIENIVPTISDAVDAFGVCCLSEAMAIRELGCNTSCILFGGLNSNNELLQASNNRIELVLHAAWQLELILNTKLKTPIRVWIKLDSGMHRLGFPANEVKAVYQQLKDCSWVHPNVGLMSHFACADTPDDIKNQQQLQCFELVRHSLGDDLRLSLANSAAIISHPSSHFDWVRPGIMLYGISPFANVTAQSLNLQPVMHFQAKIIAVHNYAVGESVGYGATWKARRNSRIAVVAAGYGDGYPRCIKSNTLVFIQGNKVPIVGCVSMDYLTIDISDYPQICVGDMTELWGANIPIESVAKSAGTIAYELLSHYRSRP